MRIIFASFVVLQFLGVSSTCWAQNPNPDGDGGGPAGSITVSNVKPTGAVTGGQKNTVTADVVVNGLADGTYTVTVVAYDYNGNNKFSKTTSGTVKITNGKGTVNISADFPTPVASGDKGIVQVEVSDPTSGVADTEQSDITYN